jgi:hypothetical protein
MPRPEWILESTSFTTVSALVREIEAWLAFSDCKLIIRVLPAQFEELRAEMENWRTIGRIRLETM